MRTGNIGQDRCFSWGRVAALLCIALGGCSSETAQTGCDYESTYEAIQAQVFDGKGCTNQACHGSADNPAGALDLRDGHSLDNLVRVEGLSAAMSLVFPGDQERSLLYHKLAAKTHDSDLPAGIGGAPMPYGDQLPALTEDELELVQIWIRGGALGDTVMKGTEELMGCEEPVAADPNKIAPLAPPSTDVGVQFYSGGWRLAAEAEDEVCYATYYDFSDIIPDEAKIPCPSNWGEGRECFSYGRDELAQDAQSHHSIINIFTRVFSLLLSVAFCFLSFFFSFLHRVFSFIFSFLHSAFSFRLCFFCFSITATLKCQH